jgi:flagellar biosynthesis/type III secretory pathway protein FliH
MTDEKDIDDLDEWNFPFLNPETHQFDTDRFLFGDGEGAVFEAPKEPTPEEKLAALKEQYEQELVAIKKEYIEKAELLNQTIKKINQAADQLDAEFTQLVEAMIKRIATKIIGREIELDKMLLPKIIEELKGNLHTGNGPVRIYLSATDFAKLELNDPAVQINIDDTLQSGDVVIKTTYNEIYALLSERIDRLMRIDHE